jgi:hypothetical protein
MGKKSRTKWVRRRAALMGLPGTLGVLVRSMLLFGKQDNPRAKKNSVVRAAWWLRDQHLARGKFPRQHVLTPSADGTSPGVPAYPQFPSAAAMVKHFRAEDKAKEK